MVCCFRFFLVGAFGWCVCGCGCYCRGWRFLTIWEGFAVEEATWEPFSAFVLPEGRLKSVMVDYLSQNNLGELLRRAETLTSGTKARD